MVIVDGLPGILIKYARVPDVKTAIDTGNYGLGSISDTTMVALGKSVRTVESDSEGIAAGGIYTTEDVCVEGKWSLAGTRFDHIWLDQGKSDCIGIVQPPFLTPLGCIDFKHMDIFHNN